MSNKQSQSAKSTKAAERQEALDRLRSWLRPGDTIYTILRHRSRSGMQRVLSVLQIAPAGSREQFAGLAVAGLTLGELSYNVAKACGYALTRDDSAYVGGIKVNGAGFSASDDIKYNLGHALWPSGFGCIGEGCPSNEHANGDRDYRPHMDDCPQSAEEVGTDIPRQRAYRHWHKDGGYALKVRTL